MVNNMLHNTILRDTHVAGVIRFFHKNITHHPLQQVQVDIPEEFVAIPMDPMLIEQVLMNLLENAVFHAVGMRNLWLTVTLQDGKAVFTVADDGCGISPERMSRLFTGLPDNEARTDSGRSNMGIGLSVCRTIIEAHGSDIRVQNRPGGGAAFSFALELEENDNV
jgi:two-component system sensor histidine kinase KdpD